MMQATFPMEILETPGQVTIIQEAFTQVRRVHLRATLVAPGRPGTALCGPLDRPMDGQHARRPLSASKKRLKVK